MIDDLNRDSDWSGLHVGVVGIGIAGFAAVRALRQMRARVSAIDAGEGPVQQERAATLRGLGAAVRLGDGETLPEGLDILVVSPGLPPRAPVIAAALAAGVPVWGELELAWRLRPSEAAADWLVVTGTNGKTTTTLMLESILRAAGLRTVAAGNIGVSMVDVVMAEATPGGALDAIAVEVGAPQLPFLHSMSPVASVCLNIAEDHVDLFGSFAAYIEAKARIYPRTQVAAVYNVADEVTRRLVAEADLAGGCRAVGFTLGEPEVDQLGVVGDALVDRAFDGEPGGSGHVLAHVADVRPAAPHNVANALAAAALARARGVSPQAVRDGLLSFRPAGHRIAEVGTVAGVRYVDDSKATNCHAAQTSLLAYDRVVWIAGGMAKGQQFDELVELTAGHMIGVVLLGVDRAVIGEALARHAPQLPIVEVTRVDTGAMDEVVAAAAEMAGPGATVLLAPGCASWDMFRDYAQRGDMFAASVAALGREGG